MSLILAGFESSVSGVGSIKLLEGQNEMSRDMRLNRVRVGWRVEWAPWTPFEAEYPSIVDRVGNVNSHLGSSWAGGSRVKS